MQVKLRTPTTYFPFDIVDVVHFNFCCYLVVVAYQLEVRFHLLDSHLILGSTKRNPFSRVFFAMLEFCEEIL